MKEVKVWNNKPRWMWVWDDDENENDKHKEYVTCILTDEQMAESGASYSVCTYNLSYSHCAEIEDSKKETRLTLYELSQLVKCFGVDFIYGNKFNYYMCLVLKVTQENDELLNGYMIRYKQGELEEPTRETVLKWCKENPDSDISRFVSFMGWSKDTE